MGELITLTEYYNSIGQKKYDDWDNNTVYYHSSRKKEFIHLRKQANTVLAIATNQIWKDGKVKISPRIEQGYFDPISVTIKEFDFVQSTCIDENYKSYHCLLEIKKENRGRPLVFKEIEPLIRKYVEKHYISKKLPESDISAESVITYVISILNPNNDKMKGPSSNTVRARLLNLYPGCKKTSRNSKK